MDARTHATTHAGGMQTDRKVCMHVTCTNHVRCTNSPTHTYPCMHMCAHTPTHTYMCMLQCAHTPTHTYMCMHKCAHTPHVTCDSPNHISHTLRTKSHIKITYHPNHTSSKWHITWGVCLQITYPNHISKSLIPWGTRLMSYVIWIMWFGWFAIRMICDLDDMWFGWFVIWMICDLDDMWFGWFVIWMICDLDDMWFGWYLIWMICDLDDMWFGWYVIWMICDLDDIWFGWYLIWICDLVRSVCDLESHVTWGVCAHGWYVIRIRYALRRETKTEVCACCSVLRCVAGCCSELRYVAVRCRVLQIHTWKRTQRQYELLYNSLQNIDVCGCVCGVGVGGSEFNRSWIWNRIRF